MKRSLAVLVVSVAVLGMLYGPARASTAPAAATAKQDVRVVNTTAEAVPVTVQGTTSVSGGVQVTNTPTVGLDPSQNGVQIVNPATAPVPVKVTVNPALTHVGVPANDIVTLSRNAAVGDTIEIHGDGYMAVFTTVPAGKALVITDVEWVGNGTAGDVTGFSISTTFFGFPTLLLGVVDKLDTNGFASRTMSMTTGIALGPGASLNLGLDGDGSANRIYAHGYYVDAP